MIVSTTYEAKTIDTLLSEIKENLVALPRFQRNIVWTDDKKQKLINSVRNGFPIGSLLLAEIDVIRDGVSHKAWRLIDGLQRTSTLQEYTADPKRYIEKSWVEPEWLGTAGEICRQATGVELDQDSLKHAVFEFMLLSGSERDRLKLFMILAQVSGTETQKFLEKADDLTDLVKSLLDGISEALDIKDRNLSIIKFVGSAEDQATAFEALNSGSVQLGKYDIAASIWRKPCDLKNETVKNEIKTYWKGRLEKLEIEIDGIKDDGTPDGYMLFDVLVGLGRVMAEKYPLLFKAEWGDSLGFQIAVIANKLRLNAINGTEDRFPLTSAGSELDVDGFVTTALDAVAKVDDALRPVLGLKLTARSIKSQFQEHAVLQICSLVCSVMIEGCGDEGKWDKPIPARSDSEKKALLGWYLIDRLRGEWGNAGDSTIFNRVWKEEQVENRRTVIVPNPVYKALPERRVAELALDTWFEEEMTKTHRERELISSTTKLLLRYFYAPRIAFFDDHAATFQIDHLVPIDFWKRLFSEVDGDGLPINGVGNLCLMNVSDHNTKSVKLPKTWFDTDVVAFEAARIERVESQYFLVPVELFEFANVAQGLLDAGGMGEPEFQSLQESFEVQGRSRWAIFRTAVLDKYFPE